MTHEHHRGTEGHELGGIEGMGTDARLPELDGAPLFLLDELPPGDDLLVAGPEGRHAVDVLRLAPGEWVRVGDGRGARTPPPSES